ncbi:hypothetical protein BJX61DRAFT_338976 [Aspergillus egyptiacus]|nr:hypothetical protein BJX61DRAFT_338976 [Aspergillus egyptiacus]
MHFTSQLLALMAAVPFGLAAPTPGPGNLPLPDGLPNPSPEQLQKIEHRAHGSMPGLPLPANVSAPGVAGLQMMAFDGFQAVAFFNELLWNITHSIEGYAVRNAVEREFAIRSLETILAQREIHALMANDALKHFGLKPIEPCRYNFPVTKMDDAIKLASMSTSYSLGHLQDVTERFAANGDVYLARLTSSLIGNLGAQQGWFRVYLDLYPSETPLLTTSDAHLGFTTAQSFTVAGSCPNVKDIVLKTFLPLEILTTPEPKTSKIKLSWTHGKDEKNETLLWLAYVNQLNSPVVVPLQVITCDGRQSTAVALFPYDDFLMNGLTIASVVNRQGPFANAAAVSESTVYGPGLIIVD